MPKKKTKRPPRPRGRPSTFTDKLANDICDQLAAGKPIRAICYQDDRPCWSTVNRWLRTNKDFQAQYARAKETFADFEFERIGDMESGVLNGTIAPDVARVAFAMMAWRLSKLRPKVYGDYRQIDAQVSGAIHVKRIILVDETKTNKKR